MFKACFRGYKDVSDGSLVQFAISFFELYQLTIATIRARKSTAGSISYTAQIPLIREGAQVYQESQTFARKQAAQAWVRKREAELDQPVAIERAHRVGATVKEMIERYMLER